MKIFLLIVLAVILIFVACSIPLILFLKDTKKLAEMPRESSLKGFMEKYESKEFINHSSINERMNTVWLAINMSPYIGLKSKKSFKAFLEKKKITIAKENQKIINNFGKFK